VQVKVVTPDASYFDGAADSVTLPAWDGEIGILPKHAPLIARLGHGVARVAEGGNTTRVAVYGGFVKVQDDVVTVLAGGAATAEGDLSAATKAYDAAQAKLAEAKAKGESKAELGDLEEKLRRARAYQSLLSPKK
jgi:F-type H+-transporting ATPase subunit epsilon